MLAVFVQLQVGLHYLNDPVVLNVPDAPPPESQTVKYHSFALTFNRTNAFVVQLRVYLNSDVNELL